MSIKEGTSTYRLRFFFDYNCGGCLWPGNDASFKKFGTGCLDAEILDLNGKVIQNARIKLPDDLKQSILYLDSLYSESLNWNDPVGTSLWNKDQWDNFYKQTGDLHSKISEQLGDDYEVIFEQK
jgi:hypothetical protein